jgi:protein-disulfide isomerase
MEDIKDNKKESYHVHHEHFEPVSSSSHNNTSKKYSPWMIACIVLGVAVIVLLILLFKGGVTAKVVKGDEAGNKLVEFLNGRTGGGVEYLSYVDKGNIYEVTVSYQGQDIPVYITKDGEYFVQGAVPLSEDASNTTTEPECSTDSECAEGEICQSGMCVAAPKDMPKSDKPKVELFVMTHCPYGTQAEKGMIPTIKALGTKADATIRFVHYFMHGDKEEAETYTQVCIREEQKAKYLTYLECFLASTGTAEDSTKCLDTAKIDKTKLNTCLADDKKKAKEYYEVDKALSQEYGVQGSPTLIINGVEASSARDPTSYLTTICSAFNTKPTVECSKKLSTASPSPGFGTAAAASGTAATDASCG